MSIRVHTLGTGTPSPTPESFGTAFAVELDEGHLVMIDCGPAATWKLAMAGLSPAALRTLFITHHHFDHNIDLPCLVLTRWDQDVTQTPLRLYGPRTTSAVVDRLFGENGAFADDYRARINWISSQRVFANRGGVLPRKPPQVDVEEVGPGFSVELDGGVRVTASHAEHAQPWLDCLSYRLDTPEGSAVFTGDTAPCDEVLELARDADLLYCMAWETDAETARTGEDQGVCSTGAAGRLAAEAHVRTLVLVHTGPRITRQRDEAIEEAKQYFDGNVVFADEVSVIDFADLDAPGDAVT